MSSTSGTAQQPGTLPKRPSWPGIRSLAGLALSALLVQTTGCGSAPRSAAPASTAGASAAGSIDIETSTAPTSSPSGLPSAARTRATPIQPANSRQSAGSAVAKTAAFRYAWKNLVVRDDFNGRSLSSSWGPYDSPGHAGNGIRSPRQISVGNGILRMTGSRDGTTGGMDSRHAQRYGRWEIRARFPAGCGCYHPVLILWPTEHSWPAGGEIDFAEVTDDPARQTLKFFLHYGADNRQLRGSRAVDMTQWHNFAVEWAPSHVTGYVDGRVFFHTTRRDVQPPGPMKQTIQLDWFPDEGRGTAILEVDWATIYRL